MKYPHTDRLIVPNLHWNNIYGDLVAIHDDKTKLTGFVETFETEELYKWEVVRDDDLKVISNGQAVSAPLAQHTVEIILDALREYTPSA